MRHHVGVNRTSLKEHFPADILVAWKNSGEHAFKNSNYWISRIFHAMDFHRIIITGWLQKCSGDESSRTTSSSSFSSSTSVPAYQLVARFLPNSTVSDEVYALTPGDPSHHFCLQEDEARLSFSRRSAFSTVHCFIQGSRWVLVINS